MSDDDNRSALLPKPIQSDKHGRLADFVQRARRFIEDQDRRILVDRPGQAEPLPLASGKPDAAFPDHRVQTVRQRRHQIRQLRHVHGAGNAVEVERFAGARQGDIVGNRRIGKEVVCDTWAILLCQRRELAPVSGSSSTLIRPPVGWNEPNQQVGQAVFPLPVSPRRRPSTRDLSRTSPGRSPARPAATDSNK